MNTSLLLHNTSSFGNDSSYKLTNNELLVISVYISFVGGLGLFGNTLVVAAFYKYRSLRTSTNTFIVHLAVCNLILALLDVIFSLPSSIRHKWILGLIACRVYGLVYHFFCSVSLNTLAIISLDRYWVITKPSIGIKITIQRAVLCILVSYLYTVLFMVPVFLQWESFREEAFYTGCYINFTDKTFQSLLNAIILGAFLFAVPFFVMIFCYGSILTSVRQKGRYAVRMRPKCKAGKWKFTIQRIPHWRTARMIVVVIFVFLICWSPYVIVSLCVAFGSQITVLTLEITLLLAKSGVIYNPFIYAALNLRFRTAFFEMLNCDRVANRTNWGVKSRVLSGVPGDSSGYLTSRASGCPSSKGLGTSLLRTVERRSSVEADTPKPGSTDQERFLIEHGISFNPNDDTLNQENCNSEELREMSDSVQNIHKRACCSKCAKTCRQAMVYVQYSSSSEQTCSSSAYHIKVCNSHRNDHCKASRNDNCSEIFKSPRVSENTKSPRIHEKPKSPRVENGKLQKCENHCKSRSEKTQNCKENVLQFGNTINANSSSKRHSNMKHNRTGSLAEVNGGYFVKVDAQNHYRRSSLHTRLPFTSNSVDIHSEQRQPLEFYCDCQCHMLSRTKGTAPRPDNNSSIKCNSNKGKKKKVTKSCSSYDDKTSHSNVQDDKAIQDICSTNQSDQSTSSSFELAQNRIEKQDPIFLRRTSEGIRAQIDSKKNTESFWRRPSQVIMNNIKPITFEQGKSLKI